MHFLPTSVEVCRCPLLIYTYATPRVNLERFLNRLIFGPGGALGRQLFYLLRSGGRAMRS